MALKMKQIILILSISAILFLSGCSEKEELVIKKTESIPSENISQETVPVVVMLPTEKPSEKAKQQEQITYETKTVTEKIEHKPVDNLAKTSYDTWLNESLSTQTKTADSKNIPGKQSTKSKTPVPEIRVFKSPIVLVTGECLIYRIKWNFANVGKLLLACKKEKINNKDVYHIVGITVPKGIWTRVGNGYNRFDSYIDSANNLPFFYYNYSGSPTTSQVTRTIIDHNTKTLTYEVKKYKAGKQYGSKNGKINFSDVVFDGLSAIYAVRGIAGEKMKPSRMPVGITKITDIYLCFLKRNIENFAVGTREYWLIQSEASEDEALFKKGTLLVSISADDERLPLILKGKVPLGTATVELVSKKTLDQDFPTDSKSLTEILTSNL